MASQKPIRFSLVAALVMGFALILPAHHHGWLTIDEPNQVGAVVFPSSSDSSPLTPSPGHRESPRHAPHDSSHCAICLVGRTLDIPHFASLGVQRLELAAVRPVAPAESIVSRESFPIFYGRAPPAFA